MSASDHLSPTQFMPLEKFKHVVSEDNYHEMHEQDSVPLNWPSPSGHHRDDLLESVKQHGLREPVVLNARAGGSGDLAYEAHTLHDGHHRAVAAVLAGVDPVPYRLHHCEPNCAEH